MSRKYTFFYGWYIVAIAGLSAILIYGLRNSFSVFFVDILEEFNWSRGLTASMLSLNILVYGIIAPIAGSCADRWNPRRFMPIALVVLGLSAALCSVAKELWHFYILIGFMMPLSTAFSGWPIFTPAFSHWFKKRRGMVMGLGSMGSGLSFAIGMLADFFISKIGWRWTYVVLGSMLVAIILPFYLFFFYYRPEHKGLKALGSEETASLESRDKVTYNNISSKSANYWTMSRALKSYRFWFMAFALGLYWGFSNYLVMTHQVRFAEDVGLQSMTAASLPALTGIFFAIGMSCGFISDIVGREWVFTTATAFSITSVMILFQVNSPSQLWLLYLHAICFGYGIGLMTPAHGAGLMDIFHGRHFGTLFGINLTALGIMGSIGPWLGGYIFDLTGSYSTAFIMAIAAFSVSCAIFWLAAPRHAFKLRVTG